MTKGTKRFGNVFMLLTFMGIGTFATTASADSATPGDRCAPQIANNAAAAGVCGPVCDKAGLKFAGNWSNASNHPPVQACKAKGEGQSVCGCAAKPGDRFASDAVTVLEIHQNFVVLGLFCRSCGRLSCSVLVATAEWCRPCAPSTPRRPTG
jgi:hypothetical protein